MPKPERHSTTSRVLIIFTLVVFMSTLMSPFAALATDPTPPPDSSASAEPSAPSPDPTAELTTEPTPEATSAPAPSNPEPSDEPTAPPAEPSPSDDPPPAPSEPTPAGPTVSFIVTFAAGADDAAEAALLSGAGATETASVPVLHMRFIDIPEDGFAAVLDELRVSPIVASVDIDRERSVEATPDDTAYPEQWALPKIGWDQLYGSVAPANSATVAILDTGVDATHPDLDDVLVPGTSVLAGSHWSSDPNGHGTWMAGIVAAEANNAYGMAGVAYAGVGVMPVVVLGADGTGQDTDIIEGVVYAADHGADVILMAFSNPGYSPALQAAIDYAWAQGAVIVAATGNEGSSSATYPAGDRGVIGVAATDQADVLAGFSNSGAAAFMAAPGVDIQASEPGGTRATISGTSAAAAHVAGGAALLAALNSSASNGAIVGRLARNADPLASGEAGNGRLNLARAASDTSTDEVQPAGAAPLGSGGPVVGPYVIASIQNNGAVSPASVAAGSTNSFQFPFRSQGNSTVGNSSFPMTLTIPTGWTAPSTSPGAGQITVTSLTCGTAPSISVSSMVITIGGTAGSCSNGNVFTLNYNTATAQGTAGTATFVITNGNGNQTVTVTAPANTPPTVDLTGPASANEGTATAYAFTTSDAQGGPFTVVSQSCGSGSLSSPSFDATTGTGGFTCTFPDGAASTAVSVQVRDSANANSNIDSISVTVANVVPSIGISGADSVNEGAPYSLTLGSVTDPGSDTVTSYIVHWGDGNTDTYASNGAKSHTYADGPASRSITVDLVDEDGTHLNRANAFSVTVANVVPSIGISGAANVNEGAPYSLTLGSVTDPGSDTVTSYIVHWGDGNTDSYAANGAKSHTYADGPASRSITVDLVDEDGTHLNRANALSVTVNNVAPQNVEGGNDQTVNEGSLVSLSGSFTDPGSADTHTFVWHVVADNGQVIADGTNQTFSFTPNDNGSYAVTFTVTDDDTGANSDSFTVTVDNVAPSITDVSVIPNPIDEGATTLVKITATDPGTADTLTYEFDCDDDLVYEISQSSDEASCGYDDGTHDYAINVRVSDDDGGSDVEASSVHVKNVAPTAALANDGPVDEGGLATITFSGASDPSTADTSAGFRYTFDCDGTNDLAASYAAADAPDNTTCTFNDNGSFTVYGRIFDKDDGYTQYSTVVTVNNVAPQNVEGGNDQTVAEGSLVSLSGSFTDPGSADTHTFVWHVVADNSQVIADGTGPSFSFTPNDNGSYAVTFTVTDDDGGANSDNFSVTVANVAPTVAISGAANVNEGAPYSLTLGSVTDPGSDTVTSYIVHWGDGNTDTYASNGAKSHTYADGPASRSITVDLVDEDGTHLNRANAFSVTVNNVAPSTPTLVTPADGLETNDGTPTFDWSDSTDPAGASDTISYVLLADNNGCSFPSPEVNEMSLSASTFTPATDLPDGLYCWQVKAKDEDGGFSDPTATHSVRIDRTAPIPVITFPANGGAYSEASWNAGCSNSVGDFCGTASDPGATASGVNNTKASMRRMAGTGPYWNGSSFSSSSEMFFSVGSTAWSMLFAYANFPSTGQYTVHAVTADDAGNEGNASSTFQLNRYTLDYLSPLDDSIAPTVVKNTGKNGRVVPVKVDVFLEGVKQTSAQIPAGDLTIKVFLMPTCSADVTDAVEMYADAGNSSGNTDDFRASGDSWIYNLDTKALGMVTNSCYRLDVYLAGVKISTQRFAVFQPTK